MNRNLDSVSASSPFLITSEFNISILVIDDDPDFLDLVSSELRQIPGTKVTTAHDCDEAVDLLTHNCFSLVVSDWEIKSKTAPTMLLTADPLMRIQLDAPCTAKIPVLFMSGSDKIGPVRHLTSLRHFEPVSFIIKRLGPSLIRLVAENILSRLYPVAGKSRSHCPVFE